MRTRLTELLGIEYPIIQGGMLWVTDPRIVIAVSESGGLGVLAAGAYPTKKELVEDIRRIKAATSRPFAVNISMMHVASTPEKEARIRSFFEAVAEEGVVAVETAGRNPAEYVPMMKEANVKVIHKCTSARFAQKAESVGADAVEVIGFEAAGHIGMDDVGAMVLTQKTVDSVQIPVVMGGGIVDARGLVAALALGAEGVIVGTRLALSQEAVTPENYRQWMLERKETDTALIQRSIRNTARVAKNTASAQVLEMEGQGRGVQDLLTITAGTKVKENVRTGNVGGMLYIGQAVGLVDEIKPAGQIISEMGAGAQALLDRLSKQLRN